MHEKHEKQCRFHSHIDIALFGSLGAVASILVFGLIHRDASIVKCQAGWLLSRLVS